jgi:hypothetical protein
MSSSPVPAIASSLASLVDGYLRVLANERGASAHTLRAYRRELQGFADFIDAALRQQPGRGGDRAHTDSRVSRHALRSRSLEGLGGARAGGMSQLVQVAGARRLCGQECGFAGGNSASCPNICRACLPLSR